MKKVVLSKRKATSTWYSAQTITDADHADYTALLANTHTQAESLLHSLEQAAGGIGFNLHANKIVFVF